MRKCKTCGKELRSAKSNYCTTCAAFHKHKYSKEELEKIREEYERLER